MNGIEIPDKTYFKIGEVARLLDLEPYVLRYWETEFDVLDPQKTRSGQRSYRREDIDILLTIRHLLYEEMFTIAGARRQLKLRREGEVSIFDAVEPGVGDEVDSPVAAGDSHQADRDREAIALAAEELADSLRASLAEALMAVDERDAHLVRLQAESDVLRVALDDARDAASQARQAAATAMQGDLHAADRQAEAEAERERLELELDGARQRMETLEAKLASTPERPVGREALATLRSQLEGLARATAALH